MRSAMTPAEQKLWLALRAHRFAGYKFRRQQPFDHYIVDFVCHSAQLIIEIDGSQHGEAPAIAHDGIRSRHLTQSGYRLLRFWNSEIFNSFDAVLDVIYVALNDPLPDPSPLTPLPQGARGISGSKGRGALESDFDARQ